ncbi:MAG: hypothetical protein FLDDKLPJ_00098 [Phycisphaerae bacterium]|nr:hypothetical protein [Phycisphaerae bacterium]
MKYLTYSGNNILAVNLPDDADVLYAPPPLPGLAKPDIPAAVRRAFEQCEGMPPLRECVNASSRVLIAFDDNCQPFPPTTLPDIRQQSIETLLELLYSYGVKRENLRMLCAVALHRKMKTHELARMLGPRIMREFHPHQLDNFDAENRANIANLGVTSEGEPVQVDRRVVESDLVIYVDSVQIPLNGGHKSVAVGLGTYDSIAPHHHPRMTQHSPHVMQPSGSHMHASIERISRVILRKARIMVMEAAMNNATYPPYVSYLGKPDSRCNIAEKFLKFATPLAMKALPEPARKIFLRGVRGAYAPVSIAAGSIDAVHARTLDVMTRQMSVNAPRQYDTMVFGLPDLSPYSVDARINPVLVVSDVLGYIFNWFYHRPLVKKGGVVILLNPLLEVFHPEYHVAYRRFYDEVLREGTDPFRMKERFQEKFARDPHLIECYRHRYAHHGFHPFTVWNWATFALNYLSDVIVVGPPDDRVARRLGVTWAKSMDHALGLAREKSGGSSVAALTIPPFFYCADPAAGAGS